MWEIVFAFVQNASEVLNKQYHLKLTSYYFGFSILTIGGLLLFEVIYMGWEQSSLKRITVKPSPSAKMDLALGIMYALNITPFLAVVMSFGLGALIPISVKKWFGYNLIQSIDSPWIQTALYVLIYDFLAYWKHRLSHQTGWWWQLHELHHSATEMNIITANRLHPLDEAFMRIFTCLPLAILGAPPSLYLWIRIAHLAQFGLIHSHLPWHWGFIGKYILVSPAGHRVHHSDYKDHRDTNYGNFIPLWDHLFGTWHKEDDVKAFTSDRATYHKSPWYGDVWNSYVRFWKVLFRVN